MDASDMNTDEREEASPSIAWSPPAETDARTGNSRARKTDPAVARAITHFAESPQIQAILRSMPEQLYITDFYGQVLLCSRKPLVVARAMDHCPPITDFLPYITADTISHIQKTLGSLRSTILHTVQKTSGDTVAPCVVTVTRLVIQNIVMWSWWIRQHDAPPAPDSTVNADGRRKGMHVLAGSIARDFNNMLMSVIGHLEIIVAQTPAKSPQRDDAMVALSSARRMADLSSRMLSSSGKGLVSWNKVDINDVIRRAAEKSSASRPESVTVQLNLSNSPVDVGGERDLLDTMAENLIANALDSMTARAGKVSIRTAALELQNHNIESLGLTNILTPGMYVRIEVADDGHGMDDETIQYIFTPFFSTKGPGHGLGLPEVQGIVGVHGGAVTASSRLLVGSSFTVWLPAYQAAETPVVVSKPGPLRLDDACILVADDEESIIRYMKRVLTPLGARVYAAEDGEQAFAEFRAHADEIQLAILDMFMPRMNGNEVTRRILRLRPNVKVLISSGYNEVFYASHFEDVQPAGFLHKPFATADFIGRIHSILHPS